MKGEADAYGVAVRAGVITPQTDDEQTFRQKMKLPAMSDDAKAAWEDDDGVRRPITLTQPGGASPLAGNGQPPDGGAAQGASTGATVNQAGAPVALAVVKPRSRKRNKPA